MESNLLCETSNRECFLIGVLNFFFSVSEQRTIKCAEETGLSLTLIV